MSYEHVAPTYLLRFDYDSEVMNLSKFMFAGRGIKGVCHADDCGYLFKNCITSRISNDAKEFKTVDRMVYIPSERVIIRLLSNLITKHLYRLITLPHLQKLGTRMLKQANQQCTGIQ